MRFQSLLAMAAVIFLSVDASSQQCESGQCFRTPVRNTVKAVAQAQPIRSTVRAAFANQAPATCGSSLGYDYDGAQITSVGPLVFQSTVSQSVPAVGSLSIASRRQSREVILAAAKQAMEDCSILPAEYQAIKLAVKSPRMLARIEDLILSQAMSSGAYSFALDRNGDPIKSAIDWEAIGDFILKIAPIIFKLIEMFAVIENAGDVQGLVMTYANLDFIASLHYQCFTAC